MLINFIKIFHNVVIGELGGMAPGTASSYLMQSNYDMDIYGEAPDKMTYTEQANKRAHCKRLTWYDICTSVLGVSDQVRKKKKKTNHTKILINEPAMLFPYRSDTELHKLIDGKRLKILF